MSLNVELQTVDRGPSPKARLDNDELLLLWFGLVRSFSLTCAQAKSCSSTFSRVECLVVWTLEANCCREIEGCTGRLAWLDYRTDARASETIGEGPKPEVAQPPVII